MLKKRIKKLEETFVTSKSNVLKSHKIDITKSVLDQVNKKLNVLIVHSLIHEAITERNPYNPDEDNMTDEEAVMIYKCIVRGESPGTKEEKALLLKYQEEQNQEHIKYTFANERDFLIKYKTATAKAWSDVDSSEEAIIIYQNTLDDIPGFTFENMSVKEFLQ